MTGPCGCPCDACSHYCEQLDQDNLAHTVTESTPSCFRGTCHCCDPGPADCHWGEPFRCRRHCPGYPEHGTEAARALCGCSACRRRCPNGNDGVGDHDHVPGEVGVVCVTCAPSWAAHTTEKERGVLATCKRIWWRFHAHIHGGTARP